MIYLYGNHRLLRECETEDEALDAIFEMEELFEVLKLQEFGAQQGLEWDFTYLITDEAGLGHVGPSETFDGDINPMFLILATLGGSDNV